MKPIDGYHPIKPDDLTWRPSNMMRIPNADYLERTGSEILGARLWRLPPQSANTLHRHVLAEEFYFVVEGVGRIRVGEETLNIMAETVFSSFRPRVTQNESASDTVREKLLVPVRTLESIIDEMNLVSRLSCTLVKSDTQGYELSVLRGLGNYIDLVKLVQCELSSIPLYDGSPFMTEIIDFLHEHHFQSVSFAPVNGESVRPLEFDYLCVNDAAA